MISLWRQLTRGIRVLVSRRAADRDIDDEVAHYIDEITANLQARGLSPKEARRAAQLEVGNTTVLREAVRENGWESTVETTAADVRYGIRRLRQSPVFAAAVALTLALGIGASTSIFSVVHPILFLSLPYPDAGRLVTIWDSQNGTPADVTFGTYQEVLKRNRLFEFLTVMKPMQATLTGIAEPERLDGQFVSADYFRVLGVKPALGRDFQSSDDRPRSPFVVIISDWFSTT